LFEENSTEISLITTMTEFEIIYDSSKVESLQFYNSSTNEFVSPVEAQSLSDQGVGKIVIGRMSSSSCSLIVHDPNCNYWECYYNTDTDKFLCEADATTLVEIGLGRIVSGKIPYIITKEKGIYFDVVKDRRVSEQAAHQLISSGVAVLKNRDSDDAQDEFVDASETNPSTDNHPSVKPSQPPSSSLSTDNHPSVKTSQPPSSSPSSHPPSSLPTSTPPSAQQGRSPSSRPTEPSARSSSLRQKPSGSSSRGPSSGEASCIAQEEKEESLLEKIAPIAAGVAVAGVAIAGVAAAMFFGGGGKDKKRKR